jgi:AcrR family transcriptional regulator
MSPRPAPDLDLRRDQIARAAREVAEAEGWPAVTMRRLATEIGVTQPVLYSAFSAGRQAVVDAVAVGGFDALATVLERAEAEPRARMRAYLDFALAQPHLYEAMFSMPSGLTFGSGDGPEPLRRAFAAIVDAFSGADENRADETGADETRAEVAWAALHGLASLQISARLPASRSEERLEDALLLLTR